MNIEACADIVEKADPDRFLTVMAAKPDQRAPLFALYAFNVEISRAPWVTAEPMIAEMRLQWWRDAIEEIASSKQVRAHDVTEALAEVVQRHGVSTAHLDQMVTARRWDIYKDSFDGAAHFDAYIDQTSGHLIWAAAQTLGAGADTETAIRDVAYGNGVAMMLRAAAELDARGRKPLLDGTAEGISQLASSALERIKAGKTSGKIANQLAPALWPAWQAIDLLKIAKAQPERVFDGQLQTSEFRKKFSLLQRQLTSRW